MTDERGRRPGTGDYGEVRERLVAMGYLARPLDRYVLGGVARPGSFLRRHAAVSLKVAVAAGPLLGLLFALAVVVANRPRFSDARDFLVLGGAFTIVFGATVFALELLAGFVLAVLVRWRGRGVAAFPAVAARAGFAVSLALSAYLAYWWRRRSGADPGVAIDVVGLAVLVLVNAALLRVSSLASLAALVRVSDLPVATGENAERATSPAHLATPAVIAALLLTTGFFIAPRSRALDAASPYTRTPAPGRLIVLAWDGVPAWVAAAETSRSPYALHDPLHPPWLLLPLAKPPVEMLASPASLWTAVATGRRENGVGALEEERPVGLSSPVRGSVPLGDLMGALLPGRKVAVSAGVRTSKTLWEILHDHDGVGCVGWWATWPAVERGSQSLPFDLVTDRAVLALRRPSEGDFLIAPPALERRLNAEFEDDIRGLRGAGTDPARVFIPIAGVSGNAGDENRGDLEQAALIDGYAATIALKLLARAEVRDLFVHLPGLDIARVAVARRSPDKADRFVGSYADAAWDGILQIESAMGPDDMLIVIATPGRRGSPPVPPAVALSPPYHLPPQPPEPWGWMLLREPSSGKAACKVVVRDGGELALLDLAPTVLNLRGFPVSRDMEGRSRAVYPDESSRPVPVDTYGRNTLAAIPFSTADAAREQETLERLRSLGYLN